MSSTTAQSKFIEQDASGKFIAVTPSTNGQQVAQATNK